MHSCFGRMLILLIIVGLLTLIAYLTCPSERTMKMEMDDNIRQCIETNDSTKMDALDNALANFGYMFSSAEGEPDKELMATFNRFNRVECYDHGIYMTSRLFNSYYTEGVRCGIGVFGMVIPTLNYAELLMRLEPRKEYPKKELPVTIEGDSIYFGDTPDLIFRGEFD